MHIFVFSIFAVCIAGGQEIAIATEYLRLHPNETLSTVLGQLIQVRIFDSSLKPNYGQDQNNNLPDGITVFQPSSSTESSSSTTAFAPNRPNNNNHDDDDDDDDSKEKTHGSHSKASYDNHAATITIDVHQVLEVFKHELKAAEERIIAAVRHHDHHDQQTTDTPTSSTASYRIAPRILP